MSNTETLIREYKDTDKEQAAALLKETFAQEPWKEEWSKELAEARIEEIMASPYSVGYVYEELGTVLGVMCGRQATYIDGKEYFIDEFFISPAAQHKGIGSKMVAYAREKLTERGYVSMVLNTEKGYPSEKFYMKNGFKTYESLIFMYLNF